FIEKPISTAKLLLTVRNALSAAQLGRENKGLREEIEPTGELLGKSAILQSLRGQAQRVAAHGAAIFISGEPGSGKTTLARYIHQQSPRADGPFTRVSVAALANDDGERALFGAEEAGQIAYGALESANGGTLFMEDVADLPFALQARLFGALERRGFQRVGGSEIVALDAHVIVATSRDLVDEVQAGRFREDLYYLIQVLPLEVPPLREHLDDLPELLQHCLDAMTSRDNLPYRQFTVAAQNRLRHHHWPGNVRELRNVVQRLLILGDGPEVTPAEIDAAIGNRHTDSTAVAPTEGYNLPLKEARDQFEKAYFEYHLQESGGSVSKVALQSGIERTHLYRKLRALGIAVKRNNG
ncbi:MAG: sigma-54-dependent Fis family transcriptional regulator, partial [Chromatiales bacterium]|nr:sigma-54-dependent Fis family transcriptional regulator [Chromatiales bacterium]